jgi:transposase
MVNSESGDEASPSRRLALSEKRRIVELTFEPGASVAQVAQANGVNANQVAGRKGWGDGSFWHWNLFFLQ